LIRHPPAPAAFAVSIPVGPAARIREIASKSKLDIVGYPIVEAAFSQESAEKAVEQARNGHTEALMKGSLHADELMGAVVRRDTGLRTARRISHGFVMDIPKFPEAFINTDAAGIVLGARVPIILTSRADSWIARLASCAAASPVAAARRANSSKAVR